MESGNGSVMGKSQVSEALEGLEKLDKLLGGEGGADSEAEAVAEVVDAEIVEIVKSQIDAQPPRQDPLQSLPEDIRKAVVEAKEKIEGISAAESGKDAQEAKRLEAEFLKGLEKFNIRDKIVRELDEGIASALSRKNVAAAQRLSFIRDQYVQCDTLGFLRGNPRQYGFFENPDADRYSSAYNQARKKLGNSKRFKFFDIDKLEGILGDFLPEKYTPIVRVFLYRFFCFANEVKLDDYGTLVSNIITNVYKLTENPMSHKGRGAFVGGLTGVLDEYIKSEWEKKNNRG